MKLWIMDIWMEFSEKYKCISHYSNNEMIIMSKIGNATNPCVTFYHLIDILIVPN